MNIIEVEKRKTSLIKKLLIIWQSSVENTHLFLSGNEIEKIKEYVPQALLEIEHLIVIENKNKEILGFMGIVNHKLEMLFISNEERNKGFGKELLMYGIDNYLVSELSVNEQNPLAIAFMNIWDLKNIKEHNMMNKAIHILFYI